MPQCCSAQEEDNKSLFLFQASLCDAQDARDCGMRPLRRIATGALPFAMRACYHPAQDPQPSNGVIGNKPQHGVINTNERDLRL
jgi:hypothetical protein